MTIEFSMRLLSSISCLACLTVMGLYLRYEPISRKSYNRLIFYIAISDFFSAVGGLFGMSKNGTWNCFLQSFLTNYFPLASIFWTVVISYLLYDILQKPHAHSHSPTKPHGIAVDTWVHLLCWGLPLILSLLPLTTTDYGTYDGKDGWCFLRPRDGSPKWTFHFWLFASFFAWVYIAIALFLIFILYVGYVVASPSGYLQTDSIISQTIRKAIHKLIWYPVIILISWAVTTIYDLWAGFYPNEEVLADTTFMYFTFSLPLLSGLMTTTAFFGGCSEARRVVSEEWNSSFAAQCCQAKFSLLFTLSTLSSNSTESKPSSSSGPTQSPLVPAQSHSDPRKNQTTSEIAMSDFSS